MNIAIIGAGFVGLHAFYVLKEQYNCLCTVRSENHLQILKDEKVPCEILNSQLPETIEKVLFNKDVAIISVAPSIDSYEATYLDLAKNIASLILKLPKLKQIIVLSSTSVYAEFQGNHVKEHSLLATSEEKPNILIQTEKVYESLQSSNLKICIFRLGEIYGKERSFKIKLEKLQGKEIPGTGMQFVNMIHIDDITHALRFAIETKLYGTYNLVCDDHPTRSKLYEEICKKNNFKLPIFQPKMASHHGKNKIVTNDKIKSLGYLFIHPLRVLKE